MMNVRVLVSKLSVVLCVLLTSMSIVVVTHLSRDRFNKFQVLEREESKIISRWNRLLLEESAWSSLMRVERMAVNEFKMIPVSPLNSEVLKNEG
jgi:cell division protein FtsL